MILHVQFYQTINFGKILLCESLKFLWKKTKKKSQSCLKNESNLPFLKFVPFFHCRNLDEVKALRHFKANMNEMREFAYKNDEISDEVRRMLYDKSLNESVENQLKRLEKVEQLLATLEGEITLGESVDIWQEVFKNSTIDCEELKPKILTKAAILSNILNPRLKGKKLAPNVMSNAKVTMIHLLRNSEEFRVFSNYLKGEEIFANECLIGQDADIVWDIVEQTAPKLSAIAMVCSVYIML